MIAAYEARRSSWSIARYAALATATLLAIIPTPARAQEIVVWHAYRGGEQAALTAVAAAYQRSHPGVHIVLLPQPFDAYASKLESAVPTGNGPDLFIDTHDRLGAYRDASLIEAWRSPDEARLLDRLDANEAVLLDGTRYGVPLSLKCAALYVNDALFNANDPDALTSLESIARTQENLPRGTYALAMEAESAYWTSGLFGAYGTPLIDDQGRWGLRGEPAERALSQLAGLVERGVIPEEANGDLVRRLFSDGRAMTAINGPWLAPELPTSLAWHVVPLPIVEGANGEPMRPLVTVETVYLAAHSESVEAAIAFGEYLALGDGARPRARVGRQVVTDHEVFAEFEDDAFLVGFRRAAELGHLTSTDPNMRLVFIPGDRAIRKVLRGVATPHDALLEGEHRFDDLARALPEEIAPTWGILALSFLSLILTIVWVRRIRDPRFRTAVRGSVPAYRYVAHAALAVGLLVVLPLAVGAATSFFAGHGTTMHFVGIANYVDILRGRSEGVLGNGSFWLVLLVTILWTALNVALHLILGIGLALLLHRPYLKLRGVYRVLLIVPWAVPNYVTALAWRGMFHRQFGAVNAILTELGAEPISWFSYWITAFSANVATNVWLGFPFMMVVTLGALAAIPRDLYEAAAVDGANAWMRFRKITLPLLGPYLAPAVAMGAIWTFNMFNVVFLVSGGEPDGSTEILVSEAYRWAFTRGNQYGYGAAYAVLIFGIVLLGSRLLQPREGARR